ncbi:MAG: DUF2027 domain-containing protein [Tannerella sp.]|jgi:hypothetical protein|nr:DUF2027 domain-containing protein [Tannerella sp.]
MRKEDFMDVSPSSKTMLKIGDRVRFLNSVGGGVVTAFHGRNQVLVEDENGFDVPALIAECIVVGEADRRMENKEPEPYVPPVKTASKTEVKAPERHVFEETPQGERLNLSLAYLPVEPKNFMQSSFEAYLINESNYYLYFNYMSCRNNSWTSRRHGLIEPDTKIFIEEFEKSAVNELEHICVQMIALKEGRSFLLKNVMSIELRLDTVKFYKLHCFTKNDFFDEDALVVPLVANDRPEKQMLVSATDIQEAMCGKIKEERRAPKPAVKKTKPANETIEVDLHINQLLDSASGMNNADILNYQLSKFHEIMKANSGKKGQKIVFIHGKGEGVLRTAIEKELKTTYRQQARFQDASFREYGFGATMIIMISG